MCKKLLCALEVEDHEQAGGGALAAADDQVRVPHAARQRDLLCVRHLLEKRAHGALKKAQAAGTAAGRLRHSNGS